MKTVKGYLKLTVTPCEGGCNIGREIEMSDVGIEEKAMLLDAFLETIELPKAKAAVLCEMMARGIIGQGNE